MRIIDLSLPIDDTLVETHNAKIDRITHAQGVEHFNWVVMSKQPGGQERFDKGERVATKDEIPGGEMPSLEVVHSSVHMGSHVDAPFHYGSMCEGKPAKQIMDVPLEWCYGPGVVLDFTHLKFPDAITRDHVIAALKKIKYTMGIDTIGLDRPCFLMFKEFLSTKDKSKIWPCHFLGRKREYCHMERLGNLGAIPKPFGFTVSCLPVKVRNAGAGWARVVAIL
ncbi:MAG: cyclase family protein [Candidatus Omnitrophica bacterium]|nr:cyclase family protein [Candidatus Omnitrophota bacterium]